MKFFKVCPICGVHTNVLVDGVCWDCKREVDELISQGSSPQEATNVLRTKKEQERRDRLEEKERILAYLDSWQKHSAKANYVFR